MHVLNFATPVVLMGVVVLVNISISGVHSSMAFLLHTLAVS